MMHRHSHPARVLLGVACFGMLAVAAPTPQAPAPIKFARYAHVANDGRIAFTYHDDIWVADSTGANALFARRQVDCVHERSPRQRRCVRDTRHRW